MRGLSFILRLRLPPWLTSRLLLTRYSLILAAVPSRAARGAEFVIDAYLPEAHLEAARGARAAAGVSIQVVENLTEVGLQRQQEVGEGNRFAARGEIPRGLGRKE